MALIRGECGLSSIDDSPDLSHLFTAVTFQFYDTGVIPLFIFYLLSETLSIVFEKSGEKE